MEGKVKFYDWKKRYGFIEGEDKNDYFVHATGLKNKIFQDDKVRFEVAETAKGNKAVEVETIEQQGGQDR